jgi:hypothetical protein
MSTFSGLLTVFLNFIQRWNFAPSINFSTNTFANENGQNVGAAV